MTYKTILTYLDASPALDARVNLASDLSARFDAHLIGVAPTGVASLPDGGYMSVTSELIEQIQGQLDETAKAAADRFDQLCQAQNIRSHESRTVGNHHAETVLLHGRYSDLIIIGQAEPDRDPPGTSQGFVEQVLLSAGRPVIVVPHIGSPEAIGKRIIFAWDGGREAARALADALPILKAAEHVEVAVINGNKKKNAHGAIPGADIGLYLARHDVNVQVKQIASTIDIGNTLLSHANDIGADLLVMGAYGHSRIREWVMGGTTRTILQSMTVPVLLAH